MLIATRLCDVSRITSLNLYFHLASFGMIMTQINTSHPSLGGGHRECIAKDQQGNSKQSASEKIQYLEDIA